MVISQTQIESSVTNGRFSPNIGCGERKLKMFLPVSTKIQGRKRMFVALQILILGKLSSAISISSTITVVGRMSLKDGGGGIIVHDLTSQPSNKKSLTFQSRQTYF